MGKMSGVDYIIFMYNYYKLTFFLVLIRKFGQKLNFHPRLAWTRLYKSRLCANG